MQSVKESNLTLVIVKQIARLLNNINVISQQVAQNNHLLKEHA